MRLLFLLPLLVTGCKHDGTATAHSSLANVPAVPEDGNFLLWLGIALFALVILNHDNRKLK